MTIQFVDKHHTDKFFFKPKSFNQMKHSATVVIDTNVLLSAYQWREVTLREVLDTLNDLSNAGRLRIPSHVVKEFMDQRPKRIVETNQKIEKELLSKIQKPPQLISTVPFIDLLDESKQYLEAEEEFLIHFENYRKKIKEIIKSVKGFINNDPVLDTLESLIVDCYFELTPEEISKIEAETKERINKKIPPLTGGDKGKKENFDGDFIIWKHILSIENDVIFVTSDAKDDWVIKDHQNQVLSPRRELVEEFYEQTNGSTFSILSPKDFVTLFNPNMDTDIANDLEKEENENSDLFNFVLGVFNKYDPLGLYYLTKDENEYSSEVDTFIHNIPNHPSKEKLSQKLSKTIYQYYGVTEDLHYGPQMIEEIWKFIHEHAE